MAETETEKKPTAEDRKRDALAKKLRAKHAEYQLSQKKTDRLILERERLVVECVNAGMRYEGVAELIGGTSKQTVSLLVKRSVERARKNGGS